MQKTRQLLRRTVDSVDAWRESLKREDCGESRQQRHGTHSRTPSVRPTQSPTEGLEDPEKRRAQHSPAEEGKKWHQKIIDSKIFRRLGQPIDTAHSGLSAHRRSRGQPSDDALHVDGGKVEATCPSRHEEAPAPPDQGIRLQHASPMSENHAQHQEKLGGWEDLHPGESAPCSPYDTNTEAYVAALGDAPSHKASKDEGVNYYDMISNSENSQISATSGVSSVGPTGLSLIPQFRWIPKPGGGGVGFNPFMAFRRQMPHRGLAFATPMRVPGHLPEVSGVSPCEQNGEGGRPQAPGRLESYSIFLELPSPPAFDQTDSPPPAPQVPTTFSFYGPVGSIGVEASQKRRALDLARGDEGASERQYLESKSGDSSKGNSDSFFPLTLLWCDAGLLLNARHVDSPCIPSDDEAEEKNGGDVSSGSSISDDGIDFFSVEVGMGGQGPATRDGAPAATHENASPTQNGQHHPFVSPQQQGRMQKRTSNLPSLYSQAADLGAIGLGIHQRGSLPTKVDGDAPAQPSAVSAVALVSPGEQQDRPGPQPTVKSTTVDTSAGLSLDKSDGFADRSTSSSESDDSSGSGSSSDDGSAYDSDGSCSSAEEEASDLNSENLYDAPVLPSVMRHHINGSEVATRERHQAPRHSVVDGPGALLAQSIIAEDVRYDFMEVSGVDGLFASSVRGGGGGGKLGNDISTCLVRHTADSNAGAAAAESGASDEASHREPHPGSESRDPPGSYSTVAAGTVDPSESVMFISNFVLPPSRPDDALSREDRGARSEALGSGASAVLPLRCARPATVIGRTHTSTSVTAATDKIRAGDCGGGTVQSNTQPTRGGASHTASQCTTEGLKKHNGSYDSSKSFPSASVREYRQTAASPTAALQGSDASPTTPPGEPRESRFSSVSPCLYRAMNTAFSTSPYPEVSRGGNVEEEEKSHCSPTGRRSPVPSANAQSGASMVGNKGRSATDGADRNGIAPSTPSKLKHEMKLNHLEEFLPPLKSPSPIAKKAAAVPRPSETKLPVAYKAARGAASEGPIAHLLAERGMSYGPHGYDIPSI